MTRSPTRARDRVALPFLEEPPLRSALFAPVTLTSSFAAKARRLPALLVTHDEADAQAAGGTVLRTAGP
jgi:ABC-type uncharacterized transport system YnjBCD ATPase subunit